MTLEELEARIREELALLDDRIHVDLDKLEARLRGEFAVLDGRIQVDLDTLEARLRGEFAVLDDRIHLDLEKRDARIHGDLDKLEARLREAFEIRIREDGERTRSRFEAVAERIEASVRIIAEGHTHLRTIAGNHEIRLQSLEKRT